MRASDFDSIIDCPVRGNPEDCPFCDDDGQFSYYAPSNPAEPNHDVLIYAINGDGEGQVKKMLNEERANALAGAAILEPPTDNDGNVTVGADVADRMQNQLGANAPYKLDNGNSVAEKDMPNGWPSDPDLSVTELIAWLKARGNRRFADEVREAAENVGLSL